MKREQKDLFQQNPHPEEFMETEGHILNLIEAAAAVAGPYANLIIAHVNDHVVRMSVMTESFYWHRHPNSDETFLVLEGELLIDIGDKTVTLTRGEMTTVPKNVPHRTRPGTARSVNLTVELMTMETVRLDQPL
jgi:mannose-6-phosphate isomerase-like protein (cupin superfamily)